MTRLLILLLFSSFLGCSYAQNEALQSAAKTDTLRVGATNLDAYLPLLRNKRVGLIVNQSSLVGKQHLVDYLASQKLNIVSIFAPEHGFRGNIEAGKLVNNNIDKQTGVRVVSLYADHKKPTPDDLKGIDVLVFDIQDVGVRFYTYISTLYLAMQAANENGVAFIVLDRPNPLGDYVDGPVLEDDYKSFVGMLPIPIVHGLTVGELAWMIVGESWIDQSLGLHLDVIPCRGYTHHTPYTPPIKPSPNLPNIEAIRLYPSLCFFEATQVSIGRGTNSPFLQIGFPAKKMGSFSFKPRDIKGMQTNPLHEGKKCYGVDLSKLDPWAQKFSLDYIIKWNGKFPPNDPMINNERWFKLLAGNATLLDQIKAHTPEDEIRRSWKPALDAYKIKRKKYLLYPDFE